MCSCAYFGHLFCVVIVTVPVGVECCFCKSVGSLVVIKDQSKGNSGIWTVEGSRINFAVFVCISGSFLIFSSFWVIVTVQVRVEHCFFG